MTIFGQNINSIVGTMWFEKKKMAYMKDDRFNLNIIIYDYFIKISGTSCEILGLEIFFWRDCFNYALLKACQYVTTNDFFLAKVWNICMYQVCTKELVEVYSLTQEIWKNIQEWNIHDYGLHLIKINKPVKKR